MSKKHIKDSLGDRMKQYEAVPRISLISRTPVIIRLDGKAFHTFTKGLKRPYDDTLRQAMSDTSLALVQQIQGAVFAYTQSDEISILVTDWEKLNTESWYNYGVQKMVSISASIATAEFNTHFTHPSKNNMALFDSRVFNLPKEEVANYFIWRQQDATRNSIQMLGQTFFSHKQLQGKSCSAIQDMLMLELDEPINWNNIQIRHKRGTCIVSSKELVEESSDRVRRHVSCDEGCPIFTTDRSYIEQYLT